MSDTSNGNGGNAKLISYVVGAVMTSALATWAATGKSAQDTAQEAKDRAAAVEAKYDTLSAVVNLRLTAIEKAQTEQADMLRKIWARMDRRPEERER